MSTILKCDYSEREISDDLYLTIDFNGHAPHQGMLRDSCYVSGEVGHFHRDKADGPSCSARVVHAIAEFLDVRSKDCLESIPVASHQKVAPERRKYTRGGEDE
jgi:hypothetical protein